MDGGRLSHKFPEPIAPGKNGRMFSRGFNRFSASLDLASIPAFGQSREIIITGNYRSAKRHNKSNQEAA